MIQSVQASRLPHYRCKLAYRIGQEKRRECDKSKGRSTHFWGAPLLFNPDSEHRLDTEMSARQAIDTGDGVQIISNHRLCKG